MPTPPPYLFCPANPSLIILSRIFFDHETLGTLVLLTVLVIFLTSIRSLLTSTLMVNATIITVQGPSTVEEQENMLLSQSSRSTGLRTTTTPSISFLLTVADLPLPSKISYLGASLQALKIPYSAARSLPTVSALPSTLLSSLLTVTDQPPTRERPRSPTQLLEASHS